MEKVNALGKACPQPVMLAKAAVDRGTQELTVLVDNEVSATNVTRFLTSQGFTVNRSGESGNWAVAGRRSNTGESSQAEALPTPTQGYVDASVGILLLSKTLGDESLELGEALVKAFLGTLAQRTPLPSVVALMNGGVFLALPDHSACDTLKNMEKDGCRVLVCGTCTKHFGITEQICVGTISNMFEITEALLGTQRQLSVG